MIKHTPIDLSQLHASYQGDSATPDPLAQEQPSTAPRTPETEPRLSPEPAPTTDNTPEQAPAEHQQPIEAAHNEEDSETEVAVEAQKKEEAAAEQPPSADDLIQQTDDQMQPDVSDELKKHGIQVSTDPRVSVVHLPISDEAVLAHKNDPPTSANRWLSEFAQYLLHKAHIRLKKVGSRVIRVFQR